jgi:hypothetical protein
MSEINTALVNAIEKSYRMIRIIRKSMSDYHIQGLLPKDIKNMVNQNYIYSIYKSTFKNLIEDVQLSIEIVEEDMHKKESEYSKEDIIYFEKMINRIKKLEEFFDIINKQLGIIIRHVNDVSNMMNFPAKLKKPRLVLIPYNNSFNAAANRTDIFLCLFRMHKNYTKRDIMPEFTIVHELAHILQPTIKHTFSEEQELAQKEYRRIIYLYEDIYKNMHKIYFMISNKDKYKLLKGINYLETIDRILYFLPRRPFKESEKLVLEEVNNMKKECYKIVKFTRLMHKEITHYKNTPAYKLSTRILINIEEKIEKIDNNLKKILPDLLAAFYLAQIYNLLREGGVELFRYIYIDKFYGDAYERVADHRLTNSSYLVEFKYFLKLYKTNKNVWNMVFGDETKLLRNARKMDIELYEVDQAERRLRGSLMKQHIRRKSGPAVI